MDEEQEALAAAGGWTLSDAAERALDAAFDLLGERFGGWYFDGSGTPVVLVKGLDAGEQTDLLRRLGLQDQRVRLATARFSEAELERFADVLADREDDNVSAVSYDVPRSQVVLHVSRPCAGNELDELLGEVPADAVRVEVGEVWLQT